MAPTFVLVHGAWHGAWCWERLLPELEQRGARAVTVDLRCDDETAGLAEYRGIVAEACAGIDEPVLVGHSLGGITIPLVAAARPVRALVFVCGVVPFPGVSFSQQHQDDPAIFAPDNFFAGLETDELGRSYWADEDSAIGALYGECDPDDAHAAFARLRPQGQAASLDVCPLETWPDVPVVSIYGTADRTIDPAWSRRVARERLGVEAIALAADHSPFLSRPAELADALLEAA
jgi:pimeloyl-ACP methyl ester carboxylesterase